MRFDLATGTNPMFEEEPSRTMWMITPNIYVFRNVKNLKMCIYEVSVK